MFLFNACTFDVYMTQQTELKEWSNVDYTNTTAYKTVKAWNKEGIHWKRGASPEGVGGGIPTDEFSQLKRLRKLDSIIKPEKGPIQKVITHMSRQLVRKPDDKGKMSSKEYLTIQGQFTGYDFSEMQVYASFTEGWNKKPVIGKVYKSSMKFNPETGEDLGKMDVTGVSLEYWYELPSKDVTKRKKIIDKIIEGANGTYPENIQYYYKDIVSGYRDGTFSYEQFTGLNIDEMRDISKKGAGSKGPGYYRDKDNVLRDRDGNPVK